MTRRAHPRRAALGAALALAMAAGCTPGGEPAKPEPSVAASPTVEPSPSDASSPEDPFAVPAVITEEYVARVLNEIARLRADLTREILRRPIDETAIELPEADKARLADLYSDPILQFNENELADLLRSQEQRDDLVEPEAFGQLRYRVERLLTAAPCLIALVDRDFTEVDRLLDGDRSTLALTVVIPDEGANTTGWRLASLLTSDAARETSEESELRRTTVDDITSLLPQLCL